MLLVVGTFNKLRTRLGAFSRSPGTVQLREGSLTALDTGTLWPSPPSLSSPGDLIRGGHTTSGHLAPGTSRRMGKLPQQHLRVTLSSTHPQFTFCLQAPLSNLKLEFTFRVVSQPLNKIVKLVPRYHAASVAVWDVMWQCSGWNGFLPELCVVCVPKYK